MTQKDYGTDAARYRDALLHTQQKIEQLLHTPGTYQEKTVRAQRVLWALIKKNEKVLNQ